MKWGWTFVGLLVFFGWILLSWCVMTACLDLPDQPVDTRKEAIH